ncbi:MAG: hypothetical protein ACW980_20290 [Promethearchaeota archaeon]|jgi:hypothetical protein
MSKENIWYYKDSVGEWIKLKYRLDLTALEDVFEFMEDYPSKRFKKGKTIDMYYGSMKELIDKGELLTEEEYLNQNK